MSLIVSEFLVFGNPLCKTYCVVTKNIHKGTFQESSRFTECFEDKPIAQVE
jgi:hypothetical protein